MNAYAPKIGNRGGPMYVNEISKFIIEYNQEDTGRFDELLIDMQKIFNEFR